MQTQEKTNPDVLARLRVPAFLFLAAVMLLAPVYGHFFAKGDHQHLGWRMFRLKATNFCAVDYYQIVEGERRPLDRFALLGVDRSSPPLDIWRISSARRARRLGARLCEPLGQGADVRVETRCATADGWRDADRGDQNLCGGVKR